MKIPDRIRLEHIREAISEIESYVLNGWSSCQLERLLL